MKIKTELCIESLHGAIVGQNYNFSSIEINSALTVGGLTPSYGLVKSIIEACPNIEKKVMIRPRPAGFLYTEDEYSIMLEDLDVFLQMDIQGIVFGFLNKDFTIDLKRSKAFIDKIHANGKKAIFHRAIDNVNDIDIAIKQLIDLGCDQVLTSGMASSAEVGKEKLKYMQEKYGQYVVFIAGAGINAYNIDKILNFTGIKYIHGSFSNLILDPTTSNNISYKTYDDDVYLATDQDKVSEIRKKIIEIGE